MVELFFIPITMCPVTNFLFVELVSNFHIMPGTTRHNCFDCIPTLHCSPSTSSPGYVTKKRKREKNLNNREYDLKPLTPITDCSLYVSVSSQPPQGDVVSDNPPTAAGDASADLRMPPAIAAVSIIKGDSHLLVAEFVVFCCSASVSAASSQAEADNAEEDKAKEGNASKKSSEEGSISQEDVSSSEENLHQKGIGGGRVLSRRYCGCKWWYNRRSSC